MERCFSPVFVDRSSHWLVLPTPGVPVTIILGWVLGIFEFVVALVELQYWQAKNCALLYRLDKQLLGFIILGFEAG